MRTRLYALLPLLLLAGCGGGGDAGLTKSRLLDLGDQWTYARTTTTIENGETTTNSANVTWRVATAQFQGQSRLAITMTPDDQAVSRLIIRQDTFSRQVDIIGSVAGTTETTQAAVYIPGTLQQNASFPALIITPTRTVNATANVGPEESVTVRSGTYRAHKVTATSNGVTVTMWLRPGLGAPVKQVVVETGPSLTRTIDYQLTGTNVSE
ncbi:MAG: hypothetical protein ACO1SV_26820 [Fimbriimonas sp.]